MHTILQEGKPKRSSSSSNSMGLLCFSAMKQSLKQPTGCSRIFSFYSKGNGKKPYVASIQFLQTFSKTHCLFRNRKASFQSPCSKVTTLLKNDNRTTSRSKVHLARRDLKYNMYALGSRWIIAGFKAQWWIGLLLLVRSKLLLWGER